MDLGLFGGIIGILSEPQEELHLLIFVEFKRATQTTFKNSYFFMWTVFCLLVCMCTISMSGAIEVHERPLGSLKLELQMHMSSHVGSRN